MLPALGRSCWACAYVCGGVERAMMCACKSVNVELDAEVSECDSTLYAEWKSSRRAAASGAAFQTPESPLP
eukprot:1159864-Pelagomonas_calceolata.AAC.2